SGAALELDVAVAGHGSPGDELRALVIAGVGESGLAVAARITARAGVLLAVRVAERRQRPLVGARDLVGELPEAELLHERQRVAVVVDALVLEQRVRVRL